MKSLLVYIGLLIFWPWPPLPSPIFLPQEPPSSPVALLRSQDTLDALGWRFQWEWLGAKATLSNLGVDFEVIDPEDLDSWTGQLLILPNTRNLSLETIDRIKSKNILIFATYMTSYRQADSRPWTPNNFALSSLFGADFKAWVGSGPSADELELSPFLGGGRIALGRHQAMLVSPAPGARVLASWGNDDAAIVKGPRGIYVGEDLFAPENSTSPQVQRLIGRLLNQLLPGIAADPTTKAVWPQPSPPPLEIQPMGRTVQVGLGTLNGQVAFQASHQLLVNGLPQSSAWTWNGKPTILKGNPSIEVRQYRPNGTFRWSAYRGSIAIDSQGQMINTLDFEEYLAGVIPNEVPPSFPVEALKAMAVVARTYGVTHLKRHKNYDVCAEVHCQVYRGLASESQRTNQAIVTTARQVLFWGNKPAKTTFSAVCGGIAANASNVWPQDNPPAYLEGQPDFVVQPTSYHLFKESDIRRFIDSPPPCFCNDSGRFRWQQSYARSNLKAILAKGLKINLGSNFHGLSELTHLQVSARSRDGRVTTLEIGSPQHLYRVSGDDIRWLWSEGKIGTEGLQSTLFYIKTQKDTITLIGGGWGHGVGLCQEGAAGRAKAGQPYRAILEHYYPKTLLTLIESRR